jgi:hypothetical protein
MRPTMEEIEKALLLYGVISFCGGVIIGLMISHLILKLKSE